MIDTVWCYKANNLAFHNTYNKQLFNNTLQLKEILYIHLYFNFSYLAKEMPNDIIGTSKQKKERKERGVKKNKDITYSPVLTFILHVPLLLYAILSMNIFMIINIKKYNLFHKYIRHITLDMCITIIWPTFLSFLMYIKLK